MKKVSVIGIRHPEHQHLWLHGLRRDNNKWSCPGGHANDGELPQETAARELEEEVGLKLDLKELEACRNGCFNTPGGQVQVALFIAKCPPDFVFSRHDDPDGEFSRLSWINPLTHPNLHVPPERNVLVQHLRGMPQEKASYSDMAHQQMALMFPVSLGRRRFFQGNIPLHITVKSFDPSDVTKEQVIAMMPDEEVRLNPKGAVLEAGKLGDHHVLFVKGLGSTLSRLYERTRGFGTEFDQFRPHITVPEDLWQAVKDGKKVPLKIGPLELHVGNTVVKRWDAQLQKGVMRRLWPFNPKEVPESDIEASRAWTQGGAYGNRDSMKLRLSPAAKARALHKLHKETMVRRNPQTGEREFLLHRGTHLGEFDARIREGLYHGLPNMRSSWSSDWYKANRLAYDAHVADRSQKPTTISAWIPESSIVHVPNQWGEEASEFQAEKEVNVIHDKPFEVHYDYDVTKDPSQDTTGDVYDKPFNTEKRLRHKLSLKDVLPKTPFKYRPGFDKTEFQKNTLPKGFIDPAGKFYEVPEGVDHHDWIHEHTKTNAPDLHVAGPDHEPNKYADDSYTNALRAGWISVGIGRDMGAGQNIQADYNFITNRSHPATQTVRDLARKHFGTSFELLSPHPDGRRYGYYDTNHFARYGTLKETQDAPPFAYNIGKKELIPGSKATGRKPSELDRDQLKEGVRVEMEHTDDPRKAIDPKARAQFRGYKYAGKDVRSMSPEEAKGLKQHFRSGHKARLGKSEYFELLKSKNVREQKKRLFGQWKTSVNSPEREAQMNQMKQWAEKQFNMPVVRAKGKPNAQGKIIDRPDLRTETIEHIGTPDSLIHETAHLMQAPEGQPVKDFQESMDRQFGLQNVKFGYKQQARVSTEYEATAIENILRRRLGLPAHAKQRAITRPGQEMAADRPGVKVVKEWPKKPVTYKDAKGKMHEGYYAITAGKEIMSPKARLKMILRESPASTFHPKRGWELRPTADTFIRLKQEGLEKEARELARVYFANKMVKKSELRKAPGSAFSTNYREEQWIEANMPRSTFKPGYSKVKNAKVGPLHQKPLYHRVVENDSEIQHMLSHHQDPSKTGSESSDAIYRKLAENPDYKAKLWPWGKPQGYFLRYIGGKKRKLQKGVMRRLAPLKHPKYDPHTSEHMWDPDIEQVLEWMSGVGPAESREDVPVISDEARKRALHALSGRTQVRRNQRGEREFLLYRGHSSEETPIHWHIQRSSWTPHAPVAAAFARMVSQEDGTGHVTSAWIPESSIASVPKHQVRQPTTWSREHEVIVDPHSVSVHESGPWHLFVDKTVKEQAQGNIKMRLQRYKERKLQKNTLPKGFIDPAGKFYEVPEELKGLKQHFRSGHKARLGKSEYFELLKSKNVREQKKRLFGQWKTSVNSPEREAQMNQMKQWAEKQFNMPVVRAKGKPQGYFLRYIGGKKRKLQKAEQKLSGHDHLTQLLSGKYGLISAHRSGHDPETNKKMTEQLRGQLDKLGLHYTPVTGRWGGSEEQSFLVHGIDRNTLVALGKQYGQMAVIHGEDGSHEEIGIHPDYKGGMKGSGWSKVDAGDNYSEIDTPFGKIRFGLHFGKSEGFQLQKGVMRRLAPFNPKEIDPKHQERVGKWTQAGYDMPYEDEDRQKIPRLEGNVRTRALHKLTGLAQIRRNPKTGEREFLLHRGMREEEYSRHVRGNSATYPKNMTWSFDPEVAHRFGAEANWPTSEGEYKPRIYLVSSWIPESKIHHIPMMLGRLGYDLKRLGPGAFQRRDEHEVISAPGQFEVHAISPISPDPGHERDYKSRPYKKNTQDYFQSLKKSPTIAETPDEFEDEVLHPDWIHKRNLMERKLLPNKVWYTHVKWDDGRHRARAAYLRGEQHIRAFVPVRFPTVKKAMKPMRFEHYSPLSGIKEIDPSYHGKWAHGSEVKRGKLDNPLAFYYEAGSKPEDLIASKAQSKYTIELDPEKHKIYDLANDPEHHVRNAIKANQGAWNLDMVIAALKNAGYYGFSNKSSGVPNAIALFYKHPVSKEESYKHRS